MHDAYEAKQILKLPLQIEALTSHGDQLFVGTKQGHLLMYSVTFGVAGDPQVQLLRSNKYFSKKPIMQLAVVPEYSILVALTENQVSVHDIDMAVTNFPTISQVTKTKGTNLFALDVVRTKTLTGETAVAVRMVAAVRRKLQFYYWKNRKFHELREDISVPDIPKSIAWCKESVCVGFRGEYSLLKLGGQEMCELFPTGKNQEARVTLLQDDRFALGKDEQTTFISTDGNMNLQAVQWSEVPLDMIHDQPYLISVLSKNIEVRTDEPRILIQSIELPKPRLVSCSRQGKVFCASQNIVWCLKMVPVSEQVPQLLKDKQFELAITVANICDETLSDKTRRIQHIQTLYAFDLFCNTKFRDSMDVFYKLNIDPSHVIGLIGGLLPVEYQEKLSYPDTPPSLQGRELENGLLALIEFLTQVRHKLNNAATPKTLDPLPIVEGVIVIKAKKQAMQIIDTTLLKCYLQTNDALVASLLRLKDNNCHREETERALKRASKYIELVIFYNTRGLHREALELLRKHSSKSDSILRGHNRTLTYLQNLGADHIDLVCEFSTWILESNPEDGLSIFTEDVDTVENLPRPRILDFLLKTAKDLVIPYLEHLILVWKETNNLFHNSLILQYKDELFTRYQNVAEDIPDSDVAGSDHTRRKLMNLLQQQPVCYNPDAVLSQFPFNCLYEERAVLLGGAGHHRQALIIYIHVLGDLSAALAYCARHSGPGSKVYQDLVSLLVQPPEQSQLGGLELPNGVRPPDLEAAVGVLEKHGNQVDLAPVLASLPVEAPLHRLKHFLTAAIQAQVSSRHSTMVLRGLLHAEHLQVQEERIDAESVKISLDEFHICPACSKRFTNLSAFARHPGGAIVHYSCKDKPLQ